jgi:anthranilate phosphoribosyltransferase
VGNDADCEWPLQDLLPAMGSGPKSADDMTYEQARSAMTAILDGDPDPTTLGAFWLANRWKRNTPGELAGFLDAVREGSVRVAEPDADPVDCGANYDGKTDTALLGVASGLVAAAAGTPVAVHSADRVPASRGVVYRDVLAELGVETDLDPEDSAAMVDSVGFGFYYQPQFAPGVHGLLDRREAMTVRTFVNTVETLVNPANADAHLGSFFHASFGKKLIDALQESRTQDIGRVVTVQGLEGYDDVRPGYATVVAWDGNEVEESDIRAGELGLDLESKDLEVEDVRVDSARLTEEVLAGERDDHWTDAVVLNAAIRIFAGGDADSISEGLDAAREAIADGNAAERLAALQEFEPGSSGPEANPVRS